jgi:hypothetical protein
MKANDDTLFYLSYKIIVNPQILTLFPNNKSAYVITCRKIVNRFRRFGVSLKSIFRNLYENILYFKDTSSATPLTESTIAVTAESTTFTHVTTTLAFAVAKAESPSSTYATTFTTTTTTTNNNNNNNKTYVLKLSGISQGDPMEGFPQYSGGSRGK